MNASATTAETEIINHKDFFYPPGGILLWIIILLELFTFGIALCFMVWTNKAEFVSFHKTASLLDVRAGTVNTIILLTSGYFIAQSVTRFREQKIMQSNRLLLAGLLLGGLFIIIKSIEYYAKIKQGLVLGYNTFMDFYWLLTGFHLLHVVAGITILLWIRKVQKPKSLQKDISDFEAGAAFWHLCDLIWLLLFPALYLAF